MTSPLGSSGFHLPSPTLQEIDSIPTRLAVIQGLRQGWTQRANGIVTAHVHRVVDAAQRAADIMGSYLGDHMDATTTTAASLIGPALTAARTQVTPVVQTAVKYGHPLDQTMLKPPPPKRSRKKKAQPAAVAEPLASGPDAVAAAVCKSQGGWLGWDGRQWICHGPNGPTFGTGESGSVPAASPVGASSGGQDSYWSGSLGAIMAPGAGSGPFTLPAVPPLAPGGGGKPPIQGPPGALIPPGGGVLQKPPPGLPAGGGEMPPPPVNWFPVAVPAMPGDGLLPGALPAMPAGGLMPMPPAMPGGGLMPMPPAGGVMPMPPAGGGAVPPLPAAGGGAVPPMPAGGQPGGCPPPTVIVQPAQPPIVITPPPCPDCRCPQPVCNMFPGGAPIPVVQPPPCPQCNQPQPPVPAPAGPPPNVPPAGSPPAAAPSPPAAPPAAPVTVDCPDPVVTVNVPAPLVNVTVPAPVVTVVTASGSLPVSPLAPPGAVSPQPPGGASPPPAGSPPASPPPAGSPPASPPAASPPAGSTAPSPPPSPPPCPTCSLPWLSLNYPQFVLAERSAHHTDFDILVDAINLGLCCLTPAPEMPACSMPLLMRMVPDFVRAAKEQGMTDIETLRAAANVGLCRWVDEDPLLGTRKVEYLATGSAVDIDPLFDPPKSGEAGATLPPLQTGARGHCPAARFVLPDFSQEISQLIPDELKVFVGWDRVIFGLGYGVAGAIRSACECPEGSPIDRLFQAAQHMRQEWGVTGKVVGAVLDFFGQVIRSGTCDLGVIDRYITTLTGVSAGEAAPVALLSILAGVWERWAGTLPHWAATAAEHVTDYLVPTELPSAAEASELYATNYISKGTWETITRMDGFRIDYAGAGVEARRRRPDDGQLLLLRRKALSYTARLDEGKATPDGWSKEEIKDRWERTVSNFAHNGWTNDAAFADWLKASEWVASPADAVEWMLKDVEDPDIQSTFLLDAEFSKKYKGHVKEVFDWNGIGLEDARNVWRAHWRNLDPTHLYELHKRLRPGWTRLMSDADVVHLCDSIVPAAPAGITAAQLAERPVSGGFAVPTYRFELPTPIQCRTFLESLATTAWHVSEALGQADYPAFWRARLLAVSYHPLTRVDARRAYETGAITLERLISAFEDLGYAPADAATLAGFYRQQTVLLHSRKPPAQKWVKSNYNRELLYQALVAGGMREDLWPDVFAALQIQRHVLVSTECIANVRRRYLAGVLTETDARAALMGVGVPNDQIDSTIVEWNCVRKVIPRKETAAQICSEFKAGLIELKQAKEMIAALGYSPGQVRRILGTCILRKTPKTLRRAAQLPPAEAAQLAAALK